MRRSSNEDTKTPVGLPQNAIEKGEKVRKRGGFMPRSGRKGSASNRPQSFPGRTVQNREKKKNHMRRHDKKGGAPRKGSRGSTDRGESKEKKSVNPKKDECRHRPMRKKHPKERGQRRLENSRLGPEPENGNCKISKSTPPRYQTSCFQREGRITPSKT